MVPAVPLFDPQIEKARIPTMSTMVCQRGAMPRGSTCAGTGAGPGCSSGCGGNSATSADSPEATSLAWSSWDMASIVAIRIGFSNAPFVSALDDVQRESGERGFLVAGL